MNTVLTAQGITFEANRKVESAVKTAKDLIWKALDARTHQYIVILDN